MRHVGRVLVVSDDAQARDSWTRWLGSVGYETGACPGPGATRDCLRAHGNPCTVRESATIAVVDLDCAADARVCTRVPDDGGTVFVRRSTSPDGRRALLGAVEDADRHVQGLRATPLLHESVPALDLD